MTPNPKAGTQDERVEEAVKARHSDVCHRAMLASGSSEEWRNAFIEGATAMKAEAATLLREQARQLEEARQGFTWEDVGVLRATADAFEHDGIATTHASPTLHSLAARIAALLPPREPQHFNAP